jgi:hypothetical protein
MAGFQSLTASQCSQLMARINKCNEPCNRIVI